MIAARDAAVRITRSSQTRGRMMASDSAVSERLGLLSAAACFTAAIVRSAKPDGGEITPRSRSSGFNARSSIASSCSTLLAVSGL